MDNLTIIGLHKQREIFTNENAGTFIVNILQCITENKNSKNINMLEEEKVLKISNLELIKVINNNNTKFREIIFLKDGRLCSMDYNDNIKIYNQKNFQIEIEINNSELPDTFVNLKNTFFENITFFSNYYKLGCTDDNELFFYAKNCIFIILISSKEYQIIQQFPFEDFNCPNLFKFEDKIILTSWNKLKIFEKTENEYKLISDYIPENCCQTTEFLYKEKFEFKDSFIEVKNCSAHPVMQIYITDKNKELNDDNGKYCPVEIYGLFHKNQKVFIDPCYFITGDYEFLFDLNKKEMIDVYTIQKKAFKNDIKEYDNYTLDYDKVCKTCYENLSDSTFIYLSYNNCLNQIEIIKNEMDFDLTIMEKREDITGSFFLRKGDILFILSDNMINIYHF